ncbi:hypothetical protein HY632_03395 [Candidatus Uhrbacteria bacterium]|nr:hypothetical protein [Candidatus Uhrbacteria bacterium]
MQRRTKMMVIGVVLLAVLAWVWLWLGRTPAPPVPASPAAPAEAVYGSGGLSRSGDVVTPGISSPTVVPVAPPPSDVAIRQIALTFAERYGTYSSEGKFVNISDLYSLMTERYHRRMEAFVAQQLAAAPAKEFRATGTIALSTAVAIADATSPRTATARVTTQRTETRASAAPRTTTQILVVGLVETPEGWRVDDAQWES